MTVNTKQAERREVPIATLDDLRAEVDRIVAAERAGTLRITGNWSAGQIFEHVSLLMTLSLDGFGCECKPPLFLRILGRVMKPLAVKGSAAPAGYTAPDFLRPRDDVTTEEGADLVRRALDRVRAGERFTHPSPVFGKVSHEEWTRLHIGHAKLHFSFLHPEAAAAPQSAA